MTTKFVSLASVVRDHVDAYQRLTWFIFESFERECLITLNAYWATLGVRGASTREVARRFRLVQDLADFGEMSFTARPDPFDDLAQLGSEQAQPEG